VLAKVAQSVTSLGESADDERRTRMLKYTVAMVVRTICIVVGVLFANGWFMWVCFAGAIFLPYFAVIIANEKTDGKPQPTLTSAKAPTLQITAEDFINAESKP
jgi:predicted tellurium resistance membrane protein TerC